MYYYLAVCEIFSEMQVGKILRKSSFDNGSISRMKFTSYLHTDFLSIIEHFNTKFTYIIILSIYLINTKKD